MGTGCRWMRKCSPIARSRSRARAASSPISGRAGAGPAVSISGSGSRVNRAERLGGSAIGTGLAPEGAPPPIVLAGSGDRQSAECGGRDVEISGDHGIYTLRGGCRSLSVAGSGNAVQAEMMPGTRIAITGDRNVIAFVPSGPGAPPIVSLRGSNSQAWRVNGSVMSPPAASRSQFRHLGPARSGRRGDRDAERPPAQIAVSSSSAPSPSRGGAPRSAEFLGVGLQIRIVPCSASLRNALMSSS